MNLSPFQTLTATVSSVHYDHDLNLVPLLQVQTPPGLIFMIGVDTWAPINICVYNSINGSLS